MALEGITTSAKDVGKNIFDRGTSLVNWGSHKAGDLGGVLKEKGAVIMSFIKGFFSNLPHYFNVAYSATKTYSKDLIHQIKENKATSAGIAGLATAATLGFVYIVKQLTNNDTV